MSVSRRRFLGSLPLWSGFAPGALAPFVAGCGDADETIVTPLPRSEPELTDWGPAPSPGVGPFLHGVASGDPLTDAVVLWTRVTPPGAVAGDPSGEPIAVEWRLALDPQFHSIVQAGSARAEAASDFTLHVDVRGLAPGQTYYYQFRALGQASLRGRTKTLPDGAVERMRLALVTCSNYPAGFFHAYAELARADVDLVLHLGDYLYEYQNAYFGDGAPLGRLPDPMHEIVALADYRRRHAQYKLDPDLMELHRQHPWVVVWDDHELANDSSAAGAQNHYGSEGNFAERKASAERAYREWMPLRVQADPSRIYRRFACGDLLDLIMLDTRLWGRSLQVDGCNTALLAATDRQLLGSEQEAWLFEQLAASQARGARWRCIGQQVILAPLARSASGCVASSDDWDGYLASRTRLFDAIESSRIDNLVVFTGDAHSSWGTDVPRDPFDPASYDPETGRGSLLVELVTPAVSSPAAGGSAEYVLATHPHVKFNDQTHQGYVVVDVTHERVQAEWYFVADVRRAMSPGQAGGTQLGAVLAARSGLAHLVRAGSASLPREPAPAPA